MERYRSGHNEAVLKTVWGQLHMGSNPILSVAGNHGCPHFYLYGSVRLQYNDTVIRNKRLKPHYIAPLRRGIIDCRSTQVVEGARLESE